ncbi:hypothetical protein MAPG_06274 [Magnaporthiopsis poae ATCC 64411]|uniref:Uncharacterized protein n=1 Tax=Magnaporthiopsis poae (strain ATCC 64411 / 73-15) TaxID=644358 RepID=A0A0C4E1L0_MAGP6|nr:hypothetical protein MAPG_06274 [Magnaporthiopsis poae ATCC 64411]
MESIMAGAIASDALAKSHAESVASKSGKRGGGLGLGLHVKTGAADTAAVVVGNSSSSPVAAVNGTNGNNSSNNNNNKRLSWTGLGAKVAGGSEDGLFGLKMARKMCEECKGHRGRELSRLCHYVSSGAAMSVGAGYGIDDVREEDVASRRVVS